MLQHLGEDQAGLLLHDVQGVVRRDGVLALEAIGPVGVLGGALIGTEVGTPHQGVGHGGQLLLQPGRQHGQAHDLDEADVLLLDVVELGMGVVDAQGVLGGGDVVAEHQVQLVVAAPAAGDGGDGVVGLPIRLSENEGGLVGIAPPGAQDLVGQVDEALRVGGGEADHRHGPLHDAGLHILVAGEGEGGLHRRLFHGEGVVAALEVVVGQDGAAHDGQVGVGAHEVVGELAHEVQQLGEAGPVDLHGHVLAVEADAVLIVIDVGGVLQKPGRAVDGDGDDAVVGPGGVVDPAGVALIFGAQLAPGIGRGGQVPGGGNGLGVLLWLGEVDGDVQVPVLRGGDPLHIFCNAVPADIVGILAEFIVPVGGLLRAPGIEGPELLDDLGGPGGEHAHQLGVEEVPVDHRVLFEHTPGVSIVHEGSEHGGQVHGPLRRGLRLGIAVQPQGLQQGVHRPHLLTGLDEAGVQGVGHQGLDLSVHHVLSPPRSRGGGPDATSRRWR